MAEQVVRRDQDAPLAVVEDRVGGAVAGAVVHLEGAVAEAHLLAVAQHAGHVGTRAPGAEGARHGGQRAHHVLGDPVAEHRLAREVVVRLRLLGEVLDERHGHVDGGDLGARVRRHERHEPEVVDVLVGEDHQLDVLERVAEAGDPALELVERRARVRPGVHQRERLVLDQVDVHSPDRERRGDGEAVDAGGGRRGEGVVAHARITPSTSSRFSSMCSSETSDSRFRRRSGSVFEGRTLKCQSS